MHKVSSNYNYSKILSICKIYPDKIKPKLRKIYKPQKKSIILRNKSGKEISNKLFKINEERGIIKFNNNINIEEKLFISCKFDIPVRFDQNNFTYKYNEKNNLIYLDDIKLIEIVN
jgi:uncharacterized protein (TIGR02217 family)